MLATMEGMAERTAGLPGEAIRFEVTPDPGCADGDVRWSCDGGDPGSGSGRRFRTSFPTGGNYRVAARCGEAVTSFDVVISPVEQWLSDARDYYGLSIDFSRVRVRGSWAVFGPPGTGWTCNEVIRFKRPRKPEEAPDEPTLIHELGHVWEHQTGQAQVLKGLVEQLGRLFGKDPYDYGGPDGVKRADELTAFKKEGQAQILMEHWKARHGWETDSRGVPFSTPGYSDDLRRLVEGAGIGTTSARRRTAAGSIDSVAALVVNAVLAVTE